jgi:outer membrane protein TolC
VPQWHAVGDFSATLALTSALFAGIKTIRQDYRTGLVTFEKAKVQLERDVRKAYYQMLLLEENIALLRESFSAANRRVIMARTNYEAGLVPELTWLQARVSMENMRPQIDQAESSHKLALANFAMTLGLPYDTLFELEPLKETIDFIDLDITELISKAASGKLDILELQQNILYYKSARMAQALQLWTPNLIFAWNYSPAFIQDPWKDDWSDEDNWKKSGTFSITLQWKLNNLFPFTKEGQGLKDTDNQIKTANMGLAQMIRGTEIEIYNTVLSLEKTRTTAEAQRLTVEMAEQSYRLTEEAYNAGLNELLEVQNAELELRKARIGVLEQNFNYLTGLIDLEYATGVPFGTLSKNTASDTQK